MSAAPSARPRHPWPFMSPLGGQLRANPGDPTCEACGAPITTGLMAAICPRGKDCALYPTDDAPQATFEGLADLLIYYMRPRQEAKT
jgi:hypothetical protein